MAQCNISFLSNNGRDLGVVFSEQNQINILLSEKPIPGKSTRGNVGINLNGKRRLITVQGKQDGSSFDGLTTDQRLKDFVYEMEEYINANVQGRFQFVDSLGNIYNVLC